MRRLPGRLLRSLVAAGTVKRGLGVGLKALFGCFAALSGYVSAFAPGFVVGAGLLRTLTCMTLGPSTWSWSALLAGNGGQLVSLRRRGPVVFRARPAKVAAVRQRRPPTHILSVCWWSTLRPMRTNDNFDTTRDMNSKTFDLNCLHLPELPPRNWSS